MMFIRHNAGQEEVDRMKPGVLGTFFLAECILTILFIVDVSLLLRMAGFRRLYRAQHSYRFYTARAA
ncbi:hypothetical protein L2D08_00295 [Domibacillus sp. PGB-M46]|uniref:hypothetical protein n=1 Tax=Domibacillus sp. PGB-M46 TaxID=2910255 RepID=UPI001F57A601|nr:hypothetical protein [Domibacillus sp. PGB-M46]MCI2252798.1 hypothetical protein [Domibacillus sp. PGB-M46]